MKKFIFIPLVFLFLSHYGFGQADPCKVTRNYFEGDGGSSAANKVKGADGGKTIIMETDFETITIKMGSIPTGTTEMGIVNYTETPSANQLSVKIYVPGGNEVDTYDFNDDGKTAMVCNDGNGTITISWKSVVFKQTANAKVNIKTTIEVSYTGVPKTNSGGTPGNTTNPNTGNGSTTTTSNPEPAPDPDAQLKSEIAGYETQVTELTKNITAKEFELNDKKSKNQIDSIDALIAKYEIDILNQKREENKLALERSQKTLAKTLSADEKQKYIAGEEKARLQAKSIENERNTLINLKNTNVASKKAITDYTAQITSLQNEINAANPQTKLDSLHLAAKKIELERAGYEVEKNKIVAERTDKALKGKLNADESTKYIARENEWSQKINTCNGQLAEKQNQIKDENKKLKKDSNKAKIEVAKIKVKLKKLSKEISNKEKEVAKYKKKNNAEKLAVAEKELADLKKQESDLKAEMDMYNAQIKK